MTKQKAPGVSWRTDLFTWQQGPLGHWYGRGHGYSCKIRKYNNTEYTWWVEAPDGLNKGEPYQNETTTMLAADMWLYRQLHTAELSSYVNSHLNAEKRPKMRYFVRVNHSSGSPVVTAPTTKDNCIYFAQSVCSDQGDSAEIVREKRGGDVVIMRYWRDSEGLQIVEY